MAKAQKIQQFCFKLNSSFLAKHNWDLTLPIESAKQSPGTIISLADSQILTWINELNDTVDYDEKAKDIKKKIRFLKKQKTSFATKQEIKNLYKNLYKLQFKEDYLCLIIDKISDYDTANKGFTVNGIKYKRLLTTVNGVKTSTVVYTSERLEPELKKRIENGLNKDVPLVPAKKCAYQALCSSASIPVSWPKGVIVIKDCQTSFTAEMINIDDSDTTKEPVVSAPSLQKVVQSCTDGCSMMLPSLSRRWNGELGGDGNETVSGVNLRCSWTKGMAFTFDYIDWAEKHNTGYIIEDYWGDKRDIRDSELIITDNQLKLCKCYANWEDYYNKCLENHYTIRVAKTAPHETDVVRQLNYQFSMVHNMTDDDIQELITPTTNEIRDILGLDYRKSLVYLCGSNLNDDNINSVDPAAKALMINSNMIDDPYVYTRIKNMIQKRIRDAKIGVLDVYGNFQIISGDLVCMCENMFGLEPKGVLKTGEIYSKHWIDRDVKQVVCYRAPMSNAHSVRNQNISYSSEAAYWFKYIDTCVVVSAWDTMQQALNGFDMDGDLLFTTDNPVLLRTHKNLPALNCIQYNAQKKVCTEEDIINSNKKGFGSRIGAITNRITEMTSLMANYSEDSEEYKVLKYRTQCGQAQQQAEIDKAKGIISNDMPKSWYIYGENKIDEESDSEEEIGRKQLYQKICAHKKPYFFQFNYQYLHREYDSYMSNVQSKSLCQYKKGYEDIVNGENISKEEEIFISRVKNQMPIDCSPGVQNRICWAVEKAINGLEFPSRENFDYSMLKSSIQYTNADFVAIKNLYKKYISTVSNIKKKQEFNMDFYKDIDCDDEQYGDDLEQIELCFEQECYEICPNMYELCNILLDLCYNNRNNKGIVWKICEDALLDNLLKNNNGNMYYPLKTSDNCEFECCGSTFMMKKVKFGGEKL